jgi:hypothetical protein
MALMMLAAPLSAALHLCLLLETGAHALDRTNEQGEVAVTGDKHGDLSTHEIFAFSRFHDKTCAGLRSRSVSTEVPK